LIDQQTLGAECVESIGPINFWPIDFVDISVEITENAPARLRAPNDVTLAELLEQIYDGRPFEIEVSLAWVTLQSISSRTQW
jgi:hypothetical protein